MPGGRRPPPDVRFQSSCFALEGLDDQPDTSEKNRQPSKPASPFQHQGEPITAMTLAAKLAMRDISASSSISPRANSKYLVRGRPRDRSQHLRCDRRSRMRARSNHPAGRDASEPGHCPWGSRPQTRGEASGGARRVLPIEGADRLAGSDDHARRCQLFAESRAVDDQCSGGREARPASAVEGNRRSTRNIPKIPAAVEFRPSHPGGMETPVPGVTLPRRSPEGDARRSSSILPEANSRISSRGRPHDRSKYVRRDRRRSGARACSNFIQPRRFRSGSWPPARIGLANSSRRGWESATRTSR